MADTSYEYDPKTDTFRISSSVMQRMIYRMTNSKEKIKEEDDRENARRILMTAKLEWRKL